MDQKLLFLINRQWTNPALDWLMASASSFAAWAPVFVLLALFGLAFSGFRFRAFLIVAGLTVAFTDGVLAHSLKPLIDRPRPHQALDDIRQVDLARAKPRFLALFRAAEARPSRAAKGEIAGRSFPSGHTMNCFAVALVACAFFRARAAWSFAVAALVGYSRIYTGSHWPSDILVSILLGCGSAFLLLALFEALWQRLGKRFAPELVARHPVLCAR